MKKHKKPYHAFTMVEIFIALAVIGIMSAIVVPRVIDMINRGRYAKAHSEVHAIGQAIEAFHAKNQTYPVTNLTVDASEEVLFTTASLQFNDKGVAPTLSPTASMWNVVAARVAPLSSFLGAAAAATFGGPFLLEDKPDPWGRPYVVSVGGYKCVPVAATNTGRPTQSAVPDPWFVWVLSGGTTGVLTTDPTAQNIVSSSDLNVGKLIFRQQSNCTLY